MGQDRRIRNLGILAHADAGKTTLTETMLYLSGSIRSVGSVDRGTTVSDGLDVERRRGISPLDRAKYILKMRGALTSSVTS